MSPARAQVELKAQRIGCSGFAMASHFSRDSNGRQPGNLRFQHRNKLARSEPSSPQSTINTTALDYKTVEICPKKYLFFFSRLYSVDVYNGPVQEDYECQWPL